MSNTVSWEELKKLLSNDSVRAYFRANSIDTTSARDIFTLLDRNNDGVLEPEEFVDNLLKLQGHATAADMMALRRVCDRMAQQIHRIQDLVAGGHSLTRGNRIVP